MFLYNKNLQYPINIKRKDPRMAKYLMNQFGGPYGELGAAIRYFQQRYSMPDNLGKALLTDIATEELGHIEMITTMIYQLMKDIPIAELEAAGLGAFYGQFDHGIFAADGNGVPFTTGYTDSTGDYLADLESDMAAEERARATYEHLMDLTDDPDVLGPLSFLRQREIIHYIRFKELREYYLQMKK
jgi:spore coat protein JC